MNTPSTRRTLLLCATLFVTPFLASNLQASAADGAPLARLSFVQGDVRLSTGVRDQPELGKNWVQAKLDTSIEQGFSLATGDGRAELEFETGSWAYLDRNSVLFIETLQIPSSGDAQIELVLATGTASFFVRRTPNGVFHLQTHVHGLEIPDGTFLRVESYLDGTLVTPLATIGYVTVNGSPKPPMDKGKTVALPGSSAVSLDASVNSASAEWDEWVLSRLQENQSRMQEALKLSGLSDPIPGLEELPATGSFYPCPPYGTCWDPTAAQLDLSPQSAGNPSQISGQTATTVPFIRKKIAAQMISICPAVWEFTWLVPDPAHPGKTKIQKTTEWTGSGMAFCYAGTFIRHHRHFVWVVGKKHKHPPVHWVKVGSKEGIVLRHPNDAKGKPPINMKYGVLVPQKNFDKPMQVVQSDPARQVVLLNSPPRNFSGNPLKDFPKVSAPEIQANLLGTPAESHSPILYDYKSGQFMREGTTVAGVTVKPVYLGGLHGERGSAPASTGHSSGNQGSARSGRGQSYSGSGSSSSASGGRSYSGGGAPRSEPSRSVTPSYSPPPPAPAPPPPSRPH